jgi:peptide-methionine (S)-S-oxide reductase
VEFAEEREEDRGAKLTHAVADTSATRTETETETETKRNFDAPGNLLGVLGIIQCRSGGRAMTEHMLNRYAWQIVAVIFCTAIAVPPAVASETAYATFAGGCFWCIEADFEKVEGVLTVTSGYTGGEVANPTYKQVSAGVTGHTEAIRIVYDPEIVTYEELLAVFWVNIDPTVADRQFCDIGSQYRSGIFYHDEKQRAAAEESRDELSRTKKFPEPIVTEISAATAFYPAEAYHQDYYKKNPIRYSFYRKSCGRDHRLEQLWGDRK